MHRFLLAGILVSSLWGCATIPPDRSYEQLARSNVIEPDKFRDLRIEPAKPGRESRLRFQDAAIMTESGPSRFALTRLPERADSTVISLRSYPGASPFPGPGARQRIFAPHVQLLDVNFQPVAAMMEPPEWYQGYSEAFYQLDILAEPEARYILVYTNPELLEVDIRLLGAPAPSDPSETFQILIPRWVWNNRFQYQPTGKVVARVSADDEYRFVNRNAGWSVDFGTSFGGERLARATAGSDSIHAGSGVFLLGNYLWPISENGRWGIIAGAGFLYHSADTPDGRAEIDAWVTEVAATYTAVRWRLRLGFSADSSPTYTAPVAGDSRRFENTIGPVATFEWRVSEKLSLGLRFEDLEYKDKRTGETFDASNVGLMINMAF